MSDDNRQKLVESFRQILAGMPNDRAALEALTHLHEQMGHTEESERYLLRLAEVIIAESDRAASRDIIPRIRPLAERDENARCILDRLEELGDS